MKDRILNSARGLFLSRGYRSTTMDEIARGAGMSKRTLYEAFGSKHEVAREVVERELKLFRTRMTMIIRSATDPLEKLLNLSRFFTELPYPGITPIALIDLQRELPDLWERVEKVEHEVLAEMGQVIDEGKKEGIFRVDMDTEVTIAALTGALVRTMDPRFLLATSLSLEQVYADIFDLLTRGICEPESAADAIRLLEAATAGPRSADGGGASGHPASGAKRTAAGSRPGKG